ncbi:MAG: DNA topoisomerase 4 subunit A [Clostridiales bacterium]|nr:DNA topoisomerase 4 subunit A [Clostridiales bacterium]
MEKVKDTLQEKIIERTMMEVMHSSMMPYSEHVILDRALPRVEDGLKPVQRRILYSMYELGITPDKPHRKSARIVGDCLGKYHPHGDKSVYDAMVRMSQPFVMHNILIDGHGNFGNVDGDPPAAMRYTEVRLSPLALELLRDLEKDTVRWTCNFDDTTTEPEMLPGRFPNLLVNGSSGIAVGLATNIPPHNVTEVIDGVIAYIENPKIKLSQLMKIIKGPDFPTGGYIITSELEKAYEIGKGKIILRAKCHIENSDNDKRLIVIDELPYQVNKAALLESINDLREEKKGLLMGIIDITDESDRHGMRGVIKLKKDADAKAILKILFKSTQLSTNYSINTVAIADGKPQQMGLLDIIVYYVNYQRDIILRRTKFELNEAKEREHILEGLVIAVKNIDEVIKIIKSSQSVSIARESLRKRFDLSERQAQAILDLRLARLTHLEIYKLEKELADIKALIVRLTAIVQSKALQMDLVKTELLTFRKDYKESRRSIILQSIDDYKVPSFDDVKPIEDYVIAVNSLGNIKRMLKKNFTMATREFSVNTTKNEVCNNLILANSTQQILIFGSMGNAYRVDSNSITEGRWREKGGSLSNLVSDAPKQERIVKIFTIDSDNLKGNLLFFTKDGMVKRTAWSEYSVAKASFQAIKLKENDRLISIEQEKKNNSFLFVTKLGMCLHADSSDVPLQGRLSVGVKGISLTSDDYCILITQVDGDGEVIVVTDKSFAKRVIISQIDMTARYRKGIRLMQFNQKLGKELVFASSVKEPYKIVLCNQDNLLSNFSTEDIVIQDRTHSGKALSKDKNIQVQGVYIYGDKIDT